LNTTRIVCTPLDTIVRSCFDKSTPSTGNSGLSTFMPTNPAGTAELLARALRLWLLAPAPAGTAMQTAQINAAASAAGRGRSRDIGASVGKLRRITPRPEAARSRRR
jgi:hypothetical protein